MRAPRWGLALASFRVSRCSRNLDAGSGSCRWRAPGPRPVWQARALTVLRGDGEFPTPAYGSGNRVE